MRLYSFVAAAALLSASLAAHADVLYSYVGAGQTAGTTFSIDSTSFLTYSGASVAVTTSSDLFFGGADHGKLLSLRFFQGAVDGASSSISASLFSGTYIINQDGLYTSDPNSATPGATLTISGSPAAVPPAPTPEPSSIALLGTGLLGMLGVARRKRFA